MTCSFLKSDIMIIGLIGFGKVSKNLINLIKSEDIAFVTSFEGRSQKTIDSIKDAGIHVLDTFEEVAVNSDILISANSPKSALKVAQNMVNYLPFTKDASYPVLNFFKVEYADCVDKLEKELVTKYRHPGAQSSQRVQHCPLTWGSSLLWSSSARVTSLPPASGFSRCRILNSSCLASPQ